MPYRVLGDTYFTTDAESSEESLPFTYLDRPTEDDDDDILGKKPR
jgi:hypothetical protein